ncbi:hypothetical protein JCM15908A_04010 [Prevotella dentasini JCM 15908]
MAIWTERQGLLGNGTEAGSYDGGLCSWVEAGKAASVGVCAVYAYLPDIRPWNTPREAVGFEWAEAIRRCGRMGW